MTKPAPAPARASSKTGERYIHHDPQLDLYCCEIRRLDKDGSVRRWRKRAKDLEEVKAARDRFLREIAWLKEKGLL